MADQATTKKKLAKKTAEAPTDSQTPKSGRPSRPLPTDRIAFPRQLDILRAFAIASGEERKAVRNTDVAAISTFAANTLSQANAFFVSAGFLGRTAEGFVPVEAVQEFAHDYKWSPDTAAGKLASVLAETWFAEALIPRLQFRDIPETEALATLSAEVGAGPEYREQLKLLLQYLQEANLLVCEGGMVCGAQEGSPQNTNRIGERSNLNGSKPRHDFSPLAVPPTDPPAKPAEPSRPRNAFDFAVSINVSMDELDDWSADRIAAFFNGVATVINAKKGLEKVQE